MIQLTKIKTLLASLSRQFVEVTMILWLFNSLAISYAEEPELSNHMSIDGEIILDVVEPRERHNRFVVSLRERSIAPFVGSAGLQPNETSSVTNILYSCSSNPTSLSPNHKFVAECSGTGTPTSPFSKPDHFTLRQAGSKAIVYQTDLREEIIGSRWAQDSRAIAVLSMTVRVSLNPLYWFFALSGHPVQYETYFLHVIDVESLKVSTFKIPIEGSSSAGYIVGWDGK